MYAGDIAAVVGLKAIATGETLCDPTHPIVLESLVFPEPVISIAIEPRPQADMDRLGKDEPIPLQEFVDMIAKIDRYHQNLRVTSQ